MVTGDYSEMRYHGVVSCIVLLQVDAICKQMKDILEPEFSIHMIHVLENIPFLMLLEKIITPSFRC